MNEQPASAPHTPLDEQPPQPAATARVIAAAPANGGRSAPNAKKRALGAERSDHLVLLAAYDAWLDERKLGKVCGGWIVGIVVVGCVESIDVLALLWLVV